jgi:hypothetical protein
MDTTRADIWLWPPRPGPRTRLKILNPLKIYKIYDKIYLVLIVFI